MSQRMFPSTLAKCKVELSTDENIPHKINNEHPLVLRQLISELSDDKKLQEFCQGMTDYLQDEINLRLSISNTRSICSKRNKEMKQKSIMNLFVTIEGLQKEALQILIEKLPERIVERDIAFVNDALTSISYLPKVDEAYLGSHLVEMLDVAENDLKLDMLKYLTKIVRNISNEIAQNLLTLIAENELLAEQILKCLKQLGYSQEVKTSILVFIHNRLLASQRYHKIFPTILEFLFKKYDDIVQIVEKTLPTMDKVMSSDMADVKLALHKILIASIGARSSTPKLYSTLLTYSPDETKPIQIYLLLLLFESDSLKSKSVDLVIKKKVKAHCFKRELWEALFAKYFIEDTFEQLQGAILRIAFSLMESQTQKSVIFGDVGVLIFKQLFTNKFCNELMKKHMISQVRKMLSRDKNNKNINTLLKMLLDMSKEKLLEEHCGHLMSFVALHTVLSPKNMKYIFEIVCENVVKDEHMVDELRQDISKLLMGIKETQMKKGVIGAVALAKYQTKGGSSTTMLNESNASISEQVTGTLELAMDLLTFTKDMCAGNYGPLGLYYDELAMALTSDTDSKVLYHLHCGVQNAFENTFIGESQDEAGLRVPLKVQFELNKPGDAVQEIFIKIGNLVQNPSQRQRNMVLVLPPVFRFLRKVTAFRNHGQMDSIDAVLGFGVSLPDTDDLDVFGQADLPIVANCLFHCINWFRELVSAFVLLAGDEMRLKVIQRVGHIILLEDKLDAIMELIPDHKLPQSYFYDESDGPRNVAGPGPSRSAPKRAKYDSTINSTTATNTTRKKGFKKRYYDFREMDSNVMSLLRHPVSAENITTTQAQTFRSQQFQFILRDAIGKLASAMNLRPKAETLNEVTAAELLKGMEKLMKYVHRQFRLVTKDIALLMDNNELEDSPVFFTPRATDLKVSFDLVINLYKLIFSWDGFHQSTHDDLLRKYFLYFDAAEASTLATQTQQPHTSQFSQRSQFGKQLNKSINLSLSVTLMRDLKNSFVENMSKYKAQCLLLSSAAALLAVLTTIRGHMEFSRKDADKVIVQTAQTFLKRSWISLSGAPEHGKEANDNLARIIEAYLDNAKVETIKGIVNTITIEVKDFKSKKDSMNTFKAIDKSNIDIFIRCVCNALHIKLRSEVAAVLPQEQLFLWQQGLHTLQSLVDVAKGLGSTKNLRTLLNTCHSIMLAFLKSGFETIKACIKKKPDEVQALFTTWEGIFRYMHRLTCEAFDKRMTAFLNLVPKVRATLQTFVQRVKSVLVTFKCTVAFFEAVLVNKNLDGEQIMTQTSNTTDSDDDEEGQGDVDDVSETGSISDYSTAPTEQSASEIYD